MHDTTTPQEVTDQILEFCRSIDSTTSPRFVDVKPSGHAVLSECFDNTERQVFQLGGSVQYGWTIWETPGVLLDAEFHAIWRDQNGTLVDITPKDDGETRILFLPDNTRVWEKELVPNIRRVLDNSPEARKKLEIADALFAIKKRNFKNGKVDQKAATRDFLSYLASLRARQQTSPRKAGRNDPCPCGSGKKFKKCCGR